MAALKKRVSLIMESPIINVVGEKRGRGEEDRGQESAHSTLCVRPGKRCGEAAASEPGEGLTADTGQGGLPERRRTASFRILRREEEVEGRVEGLPFGLEFEWPAIRAFPATSEGKVARRAGVVCGSRPGRDGAEAAAGAAGG